VSKIVCTTFLYPHLSVWTLRPKSSCGIPLNFFFHKAEAPQQIPLRKFRRSATNAILKQTFITSGMTHFATQNPSAQQTPSTFLQIQALCKAFQEGTETRQVLRQISTAFAKGEFVALLGQSGSGKSTLLNVISGIERPSEGTIILDGTPLSQLNERQCTLFRRDRIGFIFQFFNLIPTLTVLENITLPQELAGRDRVEIAGRAMTLLERVGLADRRDAYPDKLSGGQQQRVAIARALVHDPMLVLADEPTGNLDEETGDRVLELLLELTRSAQKTLIMATHNPAIAKRADRVVRMHNGQLEEDIVTGVVA
jgi:putative ABC transport system ATP-binding protein